MLGAKTRRELRALSGGKIIDWWASLTEERLPFAVVVGPAALCHADPFLDKKGRVAHEMTTFPFVPQSLSSVMWNDDGKGKRGESGAAGQESSAGKLPPRLADSLSADFCGFLGNMPSEAQKLLQEPFIPGPGLVYRSYGEFHPGRGETTRKFWCYLADKRTVAFENAVSVTSRRGAVRWDVTCHRATRAPSDLTPR
jgi:hypothetical protein